MRCCSDAFLSLHNAHYAQLLAPFHRPPSAWLRDISLTVELDCWLTARSEFCLLGEAPAFAMSPWCRDGRPSGKPPGAHPERRRMSWPSQGPRIVELSAAATGASAMFASLPSPWPPRIRNCDRAQKLPTQTCLGRTP